MAEKVTPIPEDKADPASWLPMAYFGSTTTPLPAVTEDTEEDPDDEELAETPPEVVMILGFDPLDNDEEEVIPGKT